MVYGVIGVIRVYKGLIWFMGFICIISVYYGVLGLIRGYVVDRQDKGLLGLLGFVLLGFIRVY